MVFILRFVKISLQDQLSYINFTQNWVSHNTQQDGHNSELLSLKICLEAKHKTMNTIFQSAICWWSHFPWRMTKQNPALCLKATNVHEPAMENVLNNFIKYLVSC